MLSLSSRYDSRCITEKDNWASKKEDALHLTADMTLNEIFTNRWNTLPWVPEPKNNKKKKIRKERKSFLPSLFSTYQFSFHLNFEALVPRVGTLEDQPTIDFKNEDLTNE